jgi:hypothetical protein
MRSLAIDRHREEGKMVGRITSRVSALLKLAAAKREEASSRRGLARLISADMQIRQLEQQALALEAEAAELEQEAALLRSKARGTRNQNPLASR